MIQEYLVPSIKSEDFSKKHFFKTQGTCNISADLTTISDAALCGAAFDGNAAFCLSGSEDLSDALEGNILTLIDGTTVTIENCITIDKGAACAGGGLFYLCNISGFSGTECIQSLDCPDGSVITSCPNTGDCDQINTNSVAQFQANS